MQYQSLQTTSYSHHNLKTHFLHRTHPRKQKSTLGPGVSKNTLYIDLCVPTSNRAGKTDSQSLERNQSALAHLQHGWLVPALAGLSQAESWKLPRPRPGTRDKRVTVVFPRPDSEACMWRDSLRYHHPQLSLPHLHVGQQTLTHQPAWQASFRDIERLWALLKTLNNAWCSSSHVSHKTCLEPPQTTIYQDDHISTGGKKKNRRQENKQKGRTWQKIWGFEDMKKLLFSTHRQSHRQKPSPHYSTHEPWCVVWVFRWWAPPCTSSTVRFEYIVHRSVPFISSSQAPCETPEVIWLYQWRNSHSGFLTCSGVKQNPW